MSSQIVYDQRSPYYDTQQLSKYVDYLDVWSPVLFLPASSDLMIALENRHLRRPDLLSYELYGTSQLWWVFAVRNPDVIKDPIYDFVPGRVIYAPTRESMGAYA